MKYFKDNYFYIIDINNRYSDNFIKLYEFTNCNFQHITTYKMNNLSRIESIKLSKYGN